MFDSKGILASKTVWGGLLAVGGAVLGMFGFTVAEGDTASLMAHIDSIIVAAGGILAIYGRIVAAKKIG